MSPKLSETSNELFQRNDGMRYTYRSFITAENTAQLEVAMGVSARFAEPATLTENMRKFVAKLEPVKLGNDNSANLSQ